MGLLMATPTIGQKSRKNGRHNAAKCCKYSRSVTVFIFMAFAHPKYPICETKKTSSGDHLGIPNCAALSSRCSRTHGRLTALCLGQPQCGGAWRSGPGGLQGTNLWQCCVTLRTLKSRVGWFGWFGRFGWFGSPKCVTNNWILLDITGQLGLWCT